MMKRIILIAAACLILIGVVLFLLIFNGIIQLNNPSRAEYPVHGVDVSHYQGEIDWQTLSAQDITFAYIKATEGSSFVDECFARNWKDLQSTSLRPGAYHFFSFDSSGSTQAEHFIRTVTPADNMLPPVIDLEFYGDKAKNPPEAESVRRELDIMIDALQAHYGLKPVIYATRESYNLYLAGAYENHDIWIRNVIGRPRLSDGRSWTFWQYTNRKRMDGYSGDEKYIDVNVFNGTAAEFARYGY